MAIKDLFNIIGWKTKRRLVILESDDWGSIRMPSIAVYENLQKQGFDFEADGGYLYNKYDSLATSDDLSALFHTLDSVSDSTNRPAVLTPVAVVANPDFTRIRANDFHEYAFEPFTETLKRDESCSASYALWQEGVKHRLFVPQFHGREHLNVQAWMRALQARHANTHKAFDQGVWGISTAGDPSINLEFQAAFDLVDIDDTLYHNEVLKSGLALFEQLFKYRASYFVPPNGAFSSRIEKTCYQEGLKYLSVSRLQLVPLGEGRSRKKLHWLGQEGKNKLYYFTRNCFFEPVQPGKDWVDTCLAEISNSFRWNKPAIISTHRLNYIGALHEENRVHGLKHLKKLLNQIIKNWPEVEFLTSAELGELIKNE